jgi:hypothetical protein
MLVEEVEQTRVILSEWNMLWHHMPHASMVKKNLLSIFCDEFGIASSFIYAPDE